MVNKFCPKWVAPNTITTIGLFFVLLAFVSVLRKSPDLSGEATNEVFFFCAVCFWIYQTMDGMDGKQARRTGSGSPLGEVVDHGCDAFSACVYGTILCEAFSFDARTNRLLVALVTSCGRWNFALDTVTSTYDGLLPVNDVDAQEIQVMAQVLFLITSYIGCEGWRKLFMPAPIALVSTGRVPFGLFFMGSACVLSYISRLATVVRTIRKRREIKASLALINSKNDARTFAGSSIASNGRRKSLRISSQQSVLETKSNIDNNNNGFPPHWPSNRSLFMVYLTVCVVEICFFFTVLYADNFLAAHCCVSVMFTELMIRVMHIRVSDPNFRVFNWTHGILAYIASQVVKTTDVVGAGAVIAIASASFIHRFAHLVAQVTGCLGLHPNIFVIHKKKV